MNSTNYANMLKLAFTLVKLIDGEPLYKSDKIKKDKFEDTLDYKTLQPKFAKHQDNQEWNKFKQEFLYDQAIKWNKDIVEYIKERERAQQMSSQSSTDKLAGLDGEETKRQNIMRINEDDDSDDSPNKDNQLYEDSEDLGMLIKQYKGANRRNKQRTSSVDFKIPNSLIPCEEDMTRMHYRDDWGLKKTDNDKYLDNSYWRVPDNYNLEQLLEEQKEEKK